MNSWGQGTHVACSSRRTDERNNYTKRFWAMILLFHVSPLFFCHQNESCCNRGNNQHSLFFWLLQAQSDQMTHTDLPPSLQAHPKSGGEAPRLQPDEPLQYLTFYCKGKGTNWVSVTLPIPSHLFWGIQRTGNVPSMLKNELFHCSALPGWTLGVWTHFPGVKNDRLRFSFTPSAVPSPRWKDYFMDLREDFKLCVS